MSAFGRDWLGRSNSRELAKGPRRKAGRAVRQPDTTKLGVEQLEDRRMLAVLLGGGLAGGGDDIEALNDQAPPAGQNVGFEPTVAIENFRLNDGAADTQDVFIYRASSTGKLLISSVTDGFAGFTLDVQDATGTSLIGGAIAAGVDRTLPVVESQIYYIVATDTTIDAGGGVYTIDLGNSEAPSPANVSLSPASDTGASNNDNITSDNTPTFFIQDDISSFLPALPAGVNLGAIDSNGASGYDVQLVATNLTTGAVTNVNATRIGPSATWMATTGVLPDGRYLVSAQTVVVDATSGGAGGPNTGFSQLSVPIFVTINANTAPIVTADLLPSSDTGMLTNDNVTKINQPAFEGVATAGSTVRLLANGILVGSTVAGSDSSDLALPGSTATDGRGRWEITSEPLADGAYDITVEVEDTAGNVTTVDPQLNVGSVTDVWIDTAQPNTPFLDLTTDSGRSDADEVTNVTLPTFTITADDTPGNSFPSNPFPNDLKYRLYVRPDGNIGQPEILIVDSFLNLGAFTSGGFFTHTVSLNLNNPAGTPFPDGVHDFKLEVEDRAGNISQDFLLEVTVDTTRPPVDFGQPAVIGDGLFDGSDTGVVSNPATFGDRITSDTTPTLWGIAEANSTVMLYHDTTGNGFSADDTFLGQTVANPLDGNLALPAGYWQIESALDLKLLNGGDGRVNLLAVGVDVAGNTLPPTATNSDALTIFLDTQGPQIDAVTVAGFPGYDLFDPKPSVNGHSPLINSLNVYIDDLPNRFAADFLYNAIDSNTAEQNGIFQVVGDHVGPVVIDRVFVNNIVPANGLPASAIVTVSFAAPLPDDRYTLTILDQIVDLAGNRLDGESNAIEPTDNPDVGVIGDAVRSGNDIPGGNFVGRFTVDSRPEIGSFAAQNINIDTNGNFIWDPASPLGGDATNTDLKFVMNVADPVTGAVAPGGYGLHDLVFAGQFTNGNAPVSGDLFDQLAVFGWSEELGGKRWLIDTDSDGVVTDPDGINVLGAAGDVISTQPAIPGFNIATAIPVAGNFDGNAANGDEIGLYNAGQWAFDVNRDFVISAGEVLVNNGLLGQPIIGDFDGDGLDDAGVFNNNQFFFDMASNGFANFNGNANADQTLNWGYPGVLDRPVAVDMDQDGIDDIGLWVPGNTAQDNRPIAEWYFLISNDPLAFNRIAGTINTLNHPFEPVPFGSDLYAEFGDELALPIVGNFDPPVTADDNTGGNPGTQGSNESADFNSDGMTDGFDFLALQRGIGQSEASASQGDANGDGIANSEDTSMWQQDFGQGASAVVATTSSDLNGDGTVDGGDLGQWGNEFQQGSQEGDFFLTWQRDAAPSTSSVIAATAGGSTLDLSGVTGLSVTGVIFSGDVSENTEAAFATVNLESSFAAAAPTLAAAVSSPVDEAFAELAAAVDELAEEDEDDSLDSIINTLLA